MHHKISTIVALPFRLLSSLQTICHFKKHTPRPFILYLEEYICKNANTLVASMTLGNAMTISHGRVKTESYFTILRTIDANTVRNVRFFSPTVFVLVAVRRCRGSMIHYTMGYRFKCIVSGC